jgi:hypothetical protein
MIFIDTMINHTMYALKPPQRRSRDNAKEVLLAAVASSARVQDILESR